MFSSMLIYILIVLISKITFEKITDEEYAKQTCIIDDCLCKFFIILRRRYRNII